MSLRGEKDPFEFRNGFPSNNLSSNLKQEYPDPNLMPEPNLNSPSAPRRTKTYDEILTSTRKDGTPTATNQVGVAQAARLQGGVSATPVKEVSSTPTMVAGRVFPPWDVEIGSWGSMNRGAKNVKGPKIITKISDEIIVIEDDDEEDEEITKTTSTRASSPSLFLPLPSPRPAPRILATPTLSTIAARPTQAPKLSSKKSRPVRTGPSPIDLFSTPPPPQASASTTQIPKAVQPGLKGFVITFNLTDSGAKISNIACETCSYNATAASQKRKRVASPAFEEISRLPPNLRASQPSPCRPPSSSSSSRPANQPQTHAVASGSGTTAAQRRAEAVVRAKFEDALRKEKALDMKTVDLVMR